MRIEPSFVETLAMILARSVALFSLGFAFFVTSPQGSAHAQPPPVVTATPARERGGGFDVEQRLSELRQRLALDARQTADVRVILTDAQARLAALRAARVEPGTEPFREMRRRIVWDIEDRIWALLRCDQKDAFRLYVREKMVERQEARRERRQAGGGPGFP